MLARIASMDNHMKPYILLLFAMAFVTPFTSTAIAETAELRDQHIQAAIVLERVAEPLISEARCRVDSKCEIIFNANPGIRVTVDRRDEVRNRGSRLTVNCTEDCSFASGHSSAFLRGEREFDLFRGEEVGVEILPVLRPRVMLGKLFLIVE